MGNLRAGVEATRRLNRRDSGPEWNMPLDAGGVLVSKKVIVCHQGRGRPTRLSHASAYDHWGTALTCGWGCAVDLSTSIWAVPPTRGTLDRLLDARRCPMVVPSAILHAL